MSAIYSPESGLYQPFSLMEDDDRELIWKLEYERADLLRKKMGPNKFYTANPEWFGYLNIGREILTLASESGHFYGFMPFQIDFMGSWLNPLIKKMFCVTNRGGAKSWLTSYCAVMDCTINPRTGIPILGGSRDQSDKPFQYARNLCGWPKEPPGAPSDNPYKRSGIRDSILYANDSIIQWKNGSFIENLAASSTSTRGGRAKKLIVDEITQLKETVLSGYYGRAITSPNFKIICSGTPDDPTHRAYRWWISPPHKGCHHWYNASQTSGFHLFHWDAFDCLTEKGGWITPETLEAMKALYDTYAEYRKEILGLWTMMKGTVIRWEDANKSCDGYWIENLPRLNTYDGIIISVDGARNRHYSAVVVNGYIDRRAYVLFVWGKENITEPVLRKKIIELAKYYQGLGIPTYVVIENAPVSKSLIDNCMKECQELGIGFTTSDFTKKKDKYINNMCSFFENARIKIPQEYINLINEIFMYRWAANGKPEKGNDDFVDSLDHNLFNAWLVTRKKRDNDNPQSSTYNQPLDHPSVKLFNASDKRDWRNAVNRKWRGKSF